MDRARLVGRRAADRRQRSRRAQLATLGGQGGLPRRRRLPDLAPHGALPQRGVSRRRAADRSNARCAARGRAQRLSGQPGRSCVRRARGAPHMTTPGRQLIEAAPPQWGDLHTERWPSDREAFQAAIGRLLSRALTGERIVTWPATEPGEPVTVQLMGVPDGDREALAYLAPPSLREDGTTPNKGLDLRSVLLGWALRNDVTWTMSQVPGSVYGRLVNVDAMVCALVLVPVMGEL